MQSERVERIADWWKHRFGHLTGVFALLFAISWLAYGVHAASMLHSMDDWWFGHEQERIGHRVVSAGRWMHGLAITFLSGGHIAPGVTLFTMLALQAMAIALLLHEMGCRDRLVAFFAMALLLFHPMGIESVQIEQNHIAVGLSHLLGIGGGILAWRAARHRPSDKADLARAGANGAGAIAALTVGAAGFQQFIVLGPIAFFALWAAETLREDETGGPTTLRDAIRLVIWRLGMIGAIFALGTLSYYASAFAAKALVGTETVLQYYDIATGFVSNANILALKGESLPRVILKFWGEAQHLIAWPETLALIAITLLACFAGLRTIRLRSGVPTRMVAAVGWGGALGTALLLPFVLPGIRGHDAYSFNALAPLAFSQVVLFTLAATGTAGRALAWLPLLLGAYLTANFVTVQNASAVVALNDNRRDLLALNRLLLDIEKTDVHSAARKDGGTVRLLLIGAKPAPDVKGPYRIDDTAPPLGSSRADCSLFSCGLGQVVHGLMLISYDPVRFEDVDPAKLDDPLREEALARVADARPWPDPSSVITLSNGILMIFVGEAEPSEN
ncbi:MAG: glucosyltransferase domain-containing protein [Pseudomonadota bacterium]